jgi:CRISPR system Cascade subunit CasD
MIASTLLMRLAGPMQSWGTASHFDNRDTLREPTKSGVVGILAASLGREREEDVSDLARLWLGVRADQEGEIRYDYQTVRAARRDEVTRTQIVTRGGASQGSTISKRYYLQDAVFLVGLEGNDVAFLHTLDAALRAPVFPIGLGRRGYVPSCPVTFPGSGVREGMDLQTALEQEPWPVADLSRRVLWRAERQRPQCRLVLEADETSSITTRNDQPIGAAFSTRVFGPRPIRYAEVTPPMKEMSHARS